MLQGKTGSYNTKAVLLPAGRAPRAAALHRPWKAWLSSLALLPVCCYFLAGRGDALPLDTLNLLVHEAGHLCFFFLGEFWHAAGGSIMQVLLPAVLAGHFWQYDSPLGVQVSLLWLGQNALNVSVYAADARAQDLALMAGREHDWHHLLASLGLLDYDRAVAFLFCYVAMVSFIALLTLPFYLAHKRAGV